MELDLEQSADQIKHLERYINDLVCILALPATWSGSEASRIVHTLVEALLRLLRLDLVYARLNDAVSGAPVEVVQVDQSLRPTPQPQEIRELIAQLPAGDPPTWPELLRTRVGDADISMVPVGLGWQGQLGVIVAGCRRADFPRQTEKLVLSLAANQASTALQEARLLSEQGRVARELDERVAQLTTKLADVDERLIRQIAERTVARELDQRVAQLTTELADVNERLIRQIAARRLVEEKLRREERELRRKEAFLAEAQRLSLTGAFSWRLEANQIVWSDQLYRIFELGQDAPLTFDLIKSRMHPEDAPLLDEMIDRARGGARDFEYEHRLLMPDRSIKYLHIVAHGTRDPDGRLEYIGAVQDVTDRRVSEETLSQLRSELAHAAKVMSFGAVTASIAHELNQPLSGIVTNASTGLRMLAADPPDVEGARETARRTIRDGERASAMITRLRALFARRQRTIEPVDLNEAAREVIALSTRELRRNRVVLRTEFADNLSPVVGDRVQLQQVILNLLLNASEAMNSVEDRPRRLVVKTEQDGSDGVSLTVQDAGVGFDPQLAARLFEPFYTTKSGGMGIGLSVSRSIIESHGGRLWATPNEGPGATFAFSIPGAP